MDQGKLQCRENFLKILLSTLHGRRKALLIVLDDLLGLLGSPHRSCCARLLAPQKPPPGHSRCRADSSFYIEHRHQLQQLLETLADRSQPDRLKELQTLANPGNLQPNGLFGSVHPLVLVTIAGTPQRPFLLSLVAFSS